MADQKDSSKEYHLDLPKEQWKESYLVHWKDLMTDCQKADQKDSLKESDLVDRKDSLKESDLVDRKELMNVFRLVHRKDLWMLMGIHLERTKAIVLQLGWLMESLKGQLVENHYLHKHNKLHRPTFHYQ